MTKFLIFSISFLLGAELWALPRPMDSQTGLTLKEDSSLLLAQGRKRILQGEARGSSKQTSIDFDAAAIDGERRAPVGINVGGSKQNQGYDLINLRLRWHPEMIKSTSNLETGKGR